MEERTGKGSNHEWLDEVYEKLLVKMKAECSRVGTIIPYTTHEGKYYDVANTPWGIGFWTNGFWPGMLWQMYEATGDETYKTTAEGVEERLDAILRSFDGVDHDAGFLFLLSAVADYRKTKNLESRRRGLHAANMLAGRFNPEGKFIRAWNDWGTDDHRGWAIIDCMMNLPLLYWASETTGDPRFRQIAMAHADTAQRCFVRDDGSVNHIVEFDPETGDMVQSYGGQGYGVGSSWTRGQSWGLYGFMLSYLHTKEERYLNTARRIAHYFISNTPENGLIPVDFRQPSECSWEDSTAAAIAACGLLEMSKHVEERDSQIYLLAALRMLKALEEKRCNWKPEVDHLLEKCTAAYHDKDHEFAIIYGDYYFIEALMKLSAHELFIW